MSATGITSIQDLVQANWDVSIVLGQQNGIDAKSMTNTAAAYGQLATLEVETTLSPTTGGQIDFSSITNPSGNSVSLVPMQAGINGVSLFGGNYLHGLYEIDMDKVTLWARDWAGVLFDSRVSFASLVTQGQTVSQFVKQVAQKAGLTPKVNISNDPLVGDVSSQTVNNSTMAGNPRPLWDFLVYLARIVGANIYTTSDKSLVFEDLPTNPTVWKYVWAATLNEFLQGSVQGFPIMKLSYLHQPQRNTNFSVVVISYHGKMDAISAESAFIAGTTLSTGTKSIGPGVYTQSFGKRMTNAFSGNSLGIPVYYRRIPNLTPDAAAAQAKGIAMDIAMRFLSCTLVVDCNPNLKPLDQIQISAGSVSADPAIYGFANRSLFITSIKHTTDVPQGVESHTGRVSIIKALTVPPQPATLDSNDIAALQGGN